MRRDELDDELRPELLLDERVGARRTEDPLDERVGALLTGERLVRVGAERTGERPEDVRTLGRTFGRLFLGLGRAAGAERRCN